MGNNGNGLKPKGTHFRARCIYCGKELGEHATKDHVPPRFIFKNHSYEINEQRITVPCCIECNQKYSVVEHRLVPLFKLLKEGKTNVDIIKSYGFDFKSLMIKIALGYIFHESSTYYFEETQPTITYFLDKDVDKGRILQFRGISTNKYMENISSNPACPGLLIFEDDILIASAPTDITSEFWHDYNANHNYVRMSFYNSLFVQVQF